MTTPTAYGGRKLPLQDFEGDDFTPGAGGHYVTCMDTAVGRMLSWATNGRNDPDGRRIRAAVKPPDPNGITFAQADQAISTLGPFHLIQMPGATRAKVNAHLRAGRGLVIAGNYWTIPRAYRFQANASFRHAIFVNGINSVGNAREYDPLDPRTHGYGAVVPMSVLWPFVASLNYQVAYIPLEHL
jgi:hypothetical protein